MIYHKVLLHCLLLVFGCRSALSISNELKAFQKACNEIKDELRSMKLSLGLNEDEGEMRKRRRTMDELLSNFRQDPTILDDLEDGDEWYREFRAKEHAGGHSAGDWGDLQGGHYEGDEGSTVSWFSGPLLQGDMSDESRANQKTHIGRLDFKNSMLFSESDSMDGNIAKRSNTAQEHIGRHHATHSSGNNKDNVKDRIDSRIDCDAYERRQRPRNLMQMSQLTDPFDPTAPETNMGRNDLSHEANYKLSKIEQDEAEKYKGNKPEDLGMTDSSINSQDDSDPFKCEASPTLRPKDVEESNDGTNDGRNANKVDTQFDGDHPNSAPFESSHSHGCNLDNTQPDHFHSNGAKSSTAALLKSGGRYNGGGYNADQFNSNNAKVGPSERKQFDKGYGEDSPPNGYSKAENVVEEGRYHGAHPSGGLPHRQPPKNGHHHYDNSGGDTSNCDKSKEDESKSDQDNQYHSREGTGLSDESRNEKQKSNSRHFGVEHPVAGQNSERYSYPNWRQCKKPDGCKSWNSVSSLVKRNFNPMNEIKLKTSRRLMRKGFGASLPSYSLADTRRELNLDELLRKVQQSGKERGQNANIYKMDDDFRGSESPSVFKLPEVVADDPLKTGLDLERDHDASFGFIRTKRISDVSEQQLQKPAVRKKRSKRNVPRSQPKVSIKTNIHEKAKTATTKVGIDFEENKGRMNDRRSKGSFETELCAAHNDHFLPKRVPQIEDEFFSNNTKDEIDQNGIVANMISEHSVPSASLVKEKNGQKKPNFSERLPKEKRSIAQLLYNATTLHKMRKRGIQQIAEIQTSRTLRNIQRGFQRVQNLEPRGTVRDDEYEDIEARRKRIPAKKLNIGAELSPLRHDGFGNAREADHALRTIESWLDEEPTLSRKTKSSRVDTKESNQEKEKSLPKLVHNNTTVVCNHTVEDRNCSTTKSPLRQNGPSEVSIKTTEVSGTDQQLLLSLRNGVLNSTAYTQLENMLKNCKGNGDQDRAGTAGKKEAPADETLSISMDDKNATENTTAQQQLTEKPTENLESIGPPVMGGHKKDDRVKLNITINASVMGDEESNNFIGNGTINVRPGFAEDRERRSSMFPEFESYEGLDSFAKRKVKEKDEQEYKDSGGKAGNDRGFELFNKLDSVLSGQVTADVVDGVFKTLEKNHQLRVLLPTLKRNKPPQRTDLSEKNLVALRIRENEPDVYHTEQFMGQVMTSINRLIERQLRARSCIALSPDLAEFYELILTTLAAQETQRRKREYRMRSLANDFSKAVRAIDPNKIEEKSRVVKKLLKQYDDLPQEDQKRASDMRDDLLMDLVYLRKIRASQEVLQERHKREAIRNLFKVQPIESEVVKKFEEKYTPEFVKLLKMADLFKEASAEV